MACRALLRMTAGLVLALLLAACAADPSGGGAASSPGFARGTASRLAEPRTTSTPAPPVPAGAQIAPGGPVVVLSPIQADEPPPAAPSGGTFARG